jgi:hypothetical protein
MEKCSWQMGRLSLSGFSVLGCLLLISLMAGCSFAGPRTQQILIQASAPNADIYVDGQLRGKGSVSVTLIRNRTHTVQAKVGQCTGVALIEQTISVYGALDIVGTCVFLVPIIGVLSPGFWALQPDSVFVAVPTESGSPSPPPRDTLSSVPPPNVPY